MVYLPPMVGGTTNCTPSSSLHLKPAWILVRFTSCYAAILPRSMRKTQILVSRPLSGTLGFVRTGQVEGASSERLRLRPSPNGASEQCDRSFGASDP